MDVKIFKFQKSVWETSTLSTRLISWMLNVDIIINNGTFEFKKNFFENIILQCNHLKKILHLKRIHQKIRNSYRVNIIWNNF